MSTVIRAGEKRSTVIKHKPQELMSSDSSDSSDSSMWVMLEGVSTGAVITVLVLVG